MTLPSLHACLREPNEQRGCLGLQCIQQRGLDLIAPGLCGRSRLLPWPLSSDEKRQ